MAQGELFKEISGTQFGVKRIGPVLRMLIVGAIAFAATEFFYGSRGQDSGPLQFVLYGLVGFIPGAVSSWLAHRLMDKPKVV